MTTCEKTPGFRFQDLSLMEQTLIKLIRRHQDLLESCPESEREFHAFCVAEASKMLKTFWFCS